MQWLGPGHCSQSQQNGPNRLGQRSKGPRASVTLALWPWSALAHGLPPSPVMARFWHIARCTLARRGKVDGGDFCILAPSMQRRLCTGRHPASGAFGAYGAPVPTLMLVGDMVYFCIMHLLGMSSSAWLCQEGSAVGHAGRARCLWMFGVGFILHQL